MRPLASIVILHALSFVYAAHLATNQVSERSHGRISNRNIKAPDSHASLTRILNSNTNGADRAQTRQIHNADYSTGQKPNTQNGGSNSTTPAVKSSSAHPSKDPSQDEHQKREPHRYLTSGKTEAGLDSQPVAVPSAPKYRGPRSELSTRALATTAGGSRDVSSRPASSPPADAPTTLKQSDASDTLEPVVSLTSKSRKRGAPFDAPALPSAALVPGFALVTPKRASSPASSPALPSPVTLLSSLSAVSAPLPPSAGGVSHSNTPKRDASAPSKALFSRWNSAFDSRAPSLDPPQPIDASKHAFPPTLSAERWSDILAEPRTDGGRKMKKIILPLDRS